MLPVFDVAEMWKVCFGYGANLSSSGSAVYHMSRCHPPKKNWQGHHYSKTTKKPESRQYPFGPRGFSAVKRKSSVDVERGAKILKS